MSDRKIPAPVTDPENQKFWNATKEGRFILPRCTSCGRLHWYPRAICPHCFSDRIEWIDASGQGTIYSYSVMRRAEVPYAIAYVTLDEGPTMMTNIVDCDFDAIRIGQKVRMVLKPSEGGAPVPMFAPV